MQLASSIFSGMLQDDTSGQPNTLMTLMVGLATVLALLKTQGVMKELSYAASTPRAAKKMAGSFMRGVSYLSGHNSSRHSGRGYYNTDNIESNKKRKRIEGRPEPTNQQALSSRAPKRSEASLSTGETRRMQTPVKNEQIIVEGSTQKPAAKPKPKKIKKEIET